jgi:predicted transcriptional regulator
LFADPAWDMLLDLLQAEIAQHRVPVSSLCIAAAVPATTALRWIKTMTDVGLFKRRADPHDGRRCLSNCPRTQARRCADILGKSASSL